MSSELFKCNGFSVRTAGRQPRKFLLGLSERDWSRLNSAMEYMTKALLSGAPMMDRAEKVAGSATKLFEVRITRRGSDGPQLRVLCTVDGRAVICVRGIDKRQPRLRPRDVALADKAVKSHLGQKHERPAIEIGGGSKEPP